MRGLDAMQAPKTQHSTARRILAACALAAAPLLLTACSSSSDAPAEQEVVAEDQQDLTLTEGWVKATDGMSGVFGTLENHSDADVTLVGADADVAGMVELHETVTSGTDATMREVEGGFTVPAGGSFELEPGGDHIMLMELAGPLLAGDEVTVTLSFDNGTEVTVPVLVKDYAGAEENYDSGEADAPDEDAHGDHGEDHADH